MSKMTMIIVGVQEADDSKPDPTLRSVRMQVNFFPSLAVDYLDYIILQVKREGYYVENLCNFMDENLEQNDVISKINLWAFRSGLRVSINHKRGICFFEKL